MTSELQQILDALKRIEKRQIEALQCPRCGMVHSVGSPCIFPSKE